MANELTNAQFNFQQAQVLQNQQQQMQQNQPGQQQQIQQSQSGQQNQSNQGSQQMFGFNMMSQQNHSHPYHQQNNIIFGTFFENKKRFDRRRSLQADKPIIENLW